MFFSKILLYFCWIYAPNLSNILKIGLDRLDCFFLVRLSKDGLFDMITSGLTVV